MADFDGKWELKWFNEEISETLVKDQDIEIVTVQENGKDFLKIKWHDGSNGLHHHHHELSGKNFAFHGTSDYYNMAGHLENLGGLKLIVGHARLHKNQKHFFTSITATKKA